MADGNREAHYLSIVLQPIRICAAYKPKLGQALIGGHDLAAFQKLYQADRFYSWFGLDNPLMYAAHKAAGGMTSIYRQIGIGCERLFRQILQDALGLTREQTTWKYQVPRAKGGARTLYLDGRVVITDIVQAAARDRLSSWFHDATKFVGIEQGVADSLAGVVFEVRQGYKSKDSKRQNADIANAATAYTNAYLPCACILSTQIDGDILLRYRAEKWMVLTGIIGLENPLASTYDFLRMVIGYDLAAFLERNSAVLRAEMDSVLKTLLSPT